MDYRYICRNLCQIIAELHIVEATAEPGVNTAEAVVSHSATSALPCPGVLPCPAWQLLDV